MHDGAFVLGGQVASALAVLVTVRVLTEFLAPVEYGEMVLVVGAASMASAIIVWPVGQAILVSHARFERRGHSLEFREAVRVIAGGRIAWTFVFIGGAGMLLAPFTGVHFSIGPLAGGLFAVEARRYLVMTQLMAARRQRESALIYASDAWLRLLFSWAAIVLIAPVAHVALLGNLFGGALVSLLMPFRNSMADHARLDSSVRSEILATLKGRARPLLPSVILANLTDMSGRYIVAGSAGLAAAGIFTAAVSLVRRPFGMLNSMTDWSLKPLVADAVARGSRRDVRVALLLWFVIGGGIAIVVATGLYVWRRDVLRLLLAEEYWTAGDLVLWATAAMVLLNLANIFNGVSLVRGNARATLISTAVSATVTVLVSLLLVRLYGAVGVTIAMCIGYGAQLATGGALVLVESRSVSRLISRADSIVPLARK